MNSMSEVIVPKSDQINADDLIGGDMVITITDVRISAGQEQPVAISFDGSTKVFRPCKSMSRVLVAVWGPDANRYVGRSLKLYRDPDVKWGGLAVGGIRIREMSDMEGGRAVTLALTEKKGSRKPTIIKPLAVQQRAAAPVESDPVLGAARTAAAQGTEAFREWWKLTGPAERQAMGGIMDELKKAAARADAIAADPFGLPPIDPTPEDIARAEAEALAAADAQTQEDEQ